ncbi:signal recognition particle-docking protein FtsY [Erwinia psidii]|uniref:signal recognition particle-docking protein FtsY n=1 Tax=Erwinia psidii TaxID=69224 RepID=UPI00226B9052|nr:signal recognition particle-docking protein FtsY [Erwinia psidii]MCX8959487.1 signal recognition particle-docking protein FtsY [Erwinia psidii]
MAKNKKRGFFSWLGLGRDEAPSQEVTKETPEDKQPAVDEVTDATTPPSPEASSREDTPATVADDSATCEKSDSAPGETETVAEHRLLAADTAKAVLPVPTAEKEKQPTAPPPCPATECQPEAEQFSPQSCTVSEAEQADDTLTNAPETIARTSGEQIDIEQSVTAQVNETAEQQRPTKEGFFARLKRSLFKTRQNLGSGFISLFRGKKIDDDLFDELEEQLLIADVGVETTRRIISSLTQQADRKQLRDAEALYGLLKQEMSDILAKVESPLEMAAKTPFVILMVGVNGVGKTTTIGKLARQYQAEGKSVMLAAGDTFRAAAVEQLQVWGQRNNIPVVAQHTGADSASVIFDAIQAAKARHVDVLIADTAGRLQNKSHLMEELKKITRVMKKLDEQAPHEVMLTIDASTGQNAISQTGLFHEAVGLTGITLTKLDGTAKGGVIFSIADRFGIPIRYIGVGEGIEDLRPFKADDFIEALFAREDNADDSL